MARSRNREPPSCLFCCNVRTGTMLLAIFMLVTSLMSMIMAAIQMSTYIKEQAEIGSPDYVIQSESGEIVVSQSMIASVAGRLVMGLGFFLMVIGSLALYGVIKNRPGYLLPMLIVHLFDFLCTTATAGKALFDWPKFYMDIRHEISPYYQEQLDDVDPHWIRFMAFSSIFIALLFKYLIISVIYKCYKHIATQVLMSPHDPEISSVSVSDEDLHPTIYKLPKYEEIQKVPLVMDTDDMVHQKPPPYSAS